MKPYILLGTARIPGSNSEMFLYQRDTEFSIRVGREELMTSRVHGSEDALGTLGVKGIGNRPGARILIGGLGMGFTLRAVLDAAAADADVVVAELVPEVITWNREILGGEAGHPLRDRRVRVVEGDVAAVMTREEMWDAILLDVDNGPRAVTSNNNSRLYVDEGIARAHRMLRRGGVLAVWSASEDEQFTRTLERAGFNVEQQRPRIRAGTRARGVIWIARKRT
jgi:spermidine synthase